MFVRSFVRCASEVIRTSSLSLSEIQVFEGEVLWKCVLQFEAESFNTRISRIVRVGD